MKKMALFLVFFLTLVGCQSEKKDEMDKQITINTEEKVNLPHEIEWLADVTHDGIDDKIVVNIGTFYDDDLIEENTIVIYSGKNNNQIWSENVGTVHGDRLSVSLYTDDKGEYILIWNPEMWQGRAEYTYSILYFDDEGQESVDKTNNVIFDLNDSKVEDIDNIMKFAKEVNTEVFPKSYILLSTLEGKISYNEDLENKTTIQAFAPQDIIGQITMNLYNNGQE